MKRIKFSLDARDVREELARLINGHIKHLRNVLATVRNLKRLTVVTIAAANLTGDVNIGKEVHLDLDLAIALACLATTALHVKRKAARRVTARLRLACRSEQRANVVP